MEFTSPVPTLIIQRMIPRIFSLPTPPCTAPTHTWSVAMPCQVQRCKKKRIFFYPINANPVAKVREKTDLSHEVHADNCTVSGAFCDPSPPAYSYRSVSALLYLSSLHKQFKGGRFFFADRHPGGRAFTPTSIVDPGCGRLLAFTSGPENLHGVMPVAAGTRFLTPKCFPLT